MNLPNIGPLLLRALVNQDMYLAGGILLIYSLPDHRRHAAVGHPARADRSAHPGGEDRMIALSTTASRRRPRTAFVASNWKLVWWRFRTPSPGDGERGAADLLYIGRPGARISSRPRTPSAPTRGRPSSRCRRCICSTTARSSPWVPAIVGKRNPDDLAHGMDDRSARRRCRSRFFAHGLQLEGLRPVRDQPAPDRPRRSRPAHLPAGLRSARAAISGRASCTARRPR